jgi:uncharacterized protein (DUF983 family)
VSERLPHTSRLRVLWRGAIKRCPLCGSPDLFDGWFKMRERCPNCGHKFVRREADAFFLGAYTINLSFTLIVLGVVMVAVAARAAGAIDIPMP